MQSFPETSSCQRIDNDTAIYKSYSTIIFLHSSHDVLCKSVSNMDLEKLTTNRLGDDDVIFLEKVMIDVRSYVEILDKTLEKK